MHETHDRSEFEVAVLHLRGQLDIPDRTLAPIRNLVDCSLGRLFWKDWCDQDARDAEWMPTPGDHDDPQWHRIDGWPEQGEGHVHRKWSRRADLWLRWHSVDAWHVLDWLVTAQSDGHPWIANVDQHGHPKKLMKCHTLDRLVHEATKGLRQRNINAIVLGPGDESFVHDLGAGHTLVRLLSRSSLRLEGLRMHHCLGHGGYDQLLGDPDCGFYSVRDRDGKPIATIEIEGGYIRQFCGPANNTPADAVTALACGAFDAFGWRAWTDRPGSTESNDEYEEAARVLLQVGLARGRRG